MGTVGTTVPKATEETPWYEKPQGDLFPTHLFGAKQRRLLKKKKEELNEENEDDDGDQSDWEYGDELDDWSLNNLAYRRRKVPEIQPLEVWVPKGPVQGSLMHRIFDKLSLELVCEVLGWLHPVDLIYLCYMTPTLDELLTKKTSIWKAARSRVVPAIPDCHPLTTEKQWAYFLFSSCCTYCPKDLGPGFTTTDWKFPARICDGCINERLFDYDWKHEGNPDPESDWPLLREIIPYWSVVSWNMSEPDSEYRLWLRADVQRMKRALEDYRGRIAEGLPGAEDEFQKFCDSAKVRAKSLVQQSNLYGRQLESLKSDAVEDRKEYITTRLLDIGYEREDIEDVFDSMDRGTLLLQIPVAITESNWRQSVLPEAKDILRSHLKYRRQEEAEKTYKKFLDEKGFQMDKDFIPAHSEVVALPPFSELINSDITPKLQADSFAKAATEISLHLAAWRKKQEALLAAMLPQQADGQTPSDILGLATSVFKCKHPRSTNQGPMFLDDIPSHGRHGSQIKNGSVSWPCIQFDDMVSKALVSLVKTTGFDPETVTTEYLDELDMRFVCVGCPAGEVARHWRNCALHARAHVKTPVSGWRCLSAKEKHRVKTSEEERLKTSSSARLRCKHCSVNERFTWKGLQEHSTAHNVYHTLTSEDFKVDHRIPPDPIPLAPLPSNFSSLGGATTDFQYRCLRCQTDTNKRKRDRLFARAGVVSHIAAVHGITSPGPADYMEVPSS